MSIVKPFVSKAGRINLGLHTSNEITYPNFIKPQVESYHWFKENGLEELFESINPIKDTMERMWTLEFGKVRWDEPNRSKYEALAKGLSYDVPVYIMTRLLNNKTGEIKEQEVFVCDMPLMTDEGYFIINGVKRVVVLQIIRSEGVLFALDEETPERNFFKAILMPDRGTWYTFEFNKRDVLSVKLGNRGGRVLITELLRVIGYENDDEIRKLFADVDVDEDHKYIEETLARDFTTDKEEAIISVYNKLRPDETVTLQSAEKYIKSLFFSDRRFKLGEIGRYQLNKKLETEFPEEEATLYVEDIVAIIKKLIRVQNGEVQPDDIDHLSNRRIRSVGEVLKDELYSSMRRINKLARDKMSKYRQDVKLTPSMVLGLKPIAAGVLSFFGQNQLSVFMDQTNILSELENKRRITAAGPGGITKERAPFSLREVHHSQYSRICSVTTPESNSVGVVNQLATFAKINKYGFIESPYKKVMHVAMNDGKDCVNRILKTDIEDSDGEVLAEAGTQIDKTLAKKLKKEYENDEIAVRAYYLDEIEYLDASSEDDFNISTCVVETDEYSNILDDLVSVKYSGDFVLKDPGSVDFIDIVPSQQAGLGFGLIPFGANDHSRRTLMGSNHQRQGVPLLKQEAPLVGTGFEDVVGRQTGWGLFAEDDGEVKYVDGNRIVVDYKKDGEKEYKLVKFERSNDNTSFSQRVIVNVGEKVEKGDVLVDGPTMDQGELAVGINLRVALMVFEGYTYEDSTIISERLVKNDGLTSVHIREYTSDIRDTELGPEVLTGDIPHVNEHVLGKLDERGIVAIGSRVKAGDILAGIVAPRGEKELSAEERLLKAIFGESSREVKDNSLRLPNGEYGIVINTQLLSIEDDEKLPPGVLKRVNVWVAQTKKIDYGDKLSGRHGDKSTIASIRPVEDMPYTADGEPVDIILTPMFIKRMNMGQAEEVHYGKFAEQLGLKFAFPLFDEYNLEWLEKELDKKGYNMDQKVDLYDGRTGKKFPRKVAVGQKYVLKLHHIADEKLHARSTGPYTLVTQQPLGGKAKMGGQRFGEMEVWALEAHGAPNALQEMLTIKSDDVKGRANAYKSMIQGEKIENVNVPESFKVLNRELNALCLNLELLEHKDLDK